MERMWAWGMVLLCGCGGVDLIPRAKAPEAPSQGLDKCSIAASRSNPLVTEWPASEKANLEVKLREGSVAVAYSGCEMRLVPECRLAGGYQWLRTSVATDVIEIDSEDDLYAKLPLGAVALEGELRASGRLAMQTTVTGQVRLAGLQLGATPPSASCGKATHVLSSMSIGAFKLRSGGTLRGSASAQTPIGNAGVGTASSERLLREAGRAEKCAASTDQAPHPDCRSPIQMFLTPLPWAHKAEVRAGHKRVRFGSADADVRYEVHQEGTPLCTTPCTREVPDTSAFVMRPDKSSIASFWPQVTLPPLREVTTASDVAVRAHPSTDGLVIPGIVFSAFSGAAVIAGIPLTAVGFAGGDSDLQTAGLVTGGVGIGVLVGSLVMIGVGRSYPEVREQAARSWVLDLERGEVGVRF